MSKYWVLAADRSEARLFVRDKPRAALQEVQDFAHPAARLRAQDLEADRPGRVFAAHGHAQSDAEPATDAATREAQRFARTLATLIDRAASRNEFETLSIVAEPSFLGVLRSEFGKAARERIDIEVARHLTRRSPETIAEAIEQARP